MDTKPTSFARGNPPEERNGFYGMEEQLIAAADGSPKPIVAVVTYTLDEVVTKALAGETYPVVKAYSIEPLHDPEAIAAAGKLRDAAQKARTGVDTLDLPELEEEA